MSDYPWDGFVISFHLMDRMEVNGNTIRAEAGVINTDIAKKGLTSEFGGSCLDVSTPRPAWGHS